MSNWASVRAGSRPSTWRTRSRSRRWANASTGSKNSCDIITGLWTTPVGETFDYSGTHYTVADSPALPKPVQSPHPPIIIGGGGAKRTPALAAKFAAEFNMPFASLDMAKTQFGRVAAAVAEAGRSADSLTYSAAFVVCAGRDDAEIARRAAAIGREVDELRSNSPLVGTPEEIVDQFGAVSSRPGVQRVYLQVLDMSDLDHLELFARGGAAFG